MLIVGAPAYLARHGMPATPQALLGHNRLGANYVRTRSGWPLRDAGEELVVPLSGNAQASDGEALRRLAVAGLGLARLAAFQVREDIAAGRLIPVLEAYNPGDLRKSTPSTSARAAICRCACGRSWTFWRSASI